MRERSDSRWHCGEQFEISSKTIEQELQPVVCEQRQTDRFKENYSIDVNRSLVFTFDNTCIKTIYPTVHIPLMTSINSISHIKWDGLRAVYAGDLRPILPTVNLTSVGTGHEVAMCSHF